MDYRTVFVVTDKGMAWGPIILCAGLLCGFLLVGRWGQKKRDTNQMLFGYSLAGLNFIFLAFIAWFTASHYLAALRSFECGNYSIVEGPVERFHPMPNAGHDSERFAVSGVPFEYSDYQYSPGFNQSSSHGGPIREGLPVRISFYSRGPAFSGESNVILKLEIKDQ